MNHLLDLDWTWSGASDHAPKAGHVIRVQAASGSFSIPRRTAGTIARGSPVALDGVEGASASNFSITTVVTPAASGSSRPLTGGVAMARDSDTESASIQKSSSAGIIPGAASGERVGNSRLIPFGRPVVPVHIGHPAFVLDQGVDQSQRSPGGVIQPTRRPRQASAQVRQPPGRCSARPWQVSRSAAEPTVLAPLLSTMAASGGGRWVMIGVVQPAAGRPHDRVHVLGVLHQDGHDVVLPQTSLAEPCANRLARASNSSKLLTVGRIQDDGGLISADIRANLHAPRVRRGPATRAAGRNSAHHQPKIVCKSSPRGNSSASILQASVKTNNRTIDGLKRNRGNIAPCPWSTSGYVDQGIRQDPRIAVTPPSTAWSPRVVGAWLAMQRRRLIRNARLVATMHRHFGGVVVGAARETRPGMACIVIGNAISALNYEHLRQAYFISTTSSLATG